jgi:hypothetical protein
MMKSALLRTIAILGLPALIAAPALMAHHSTAEFDYSKEVVVEGEVKEVQWTNPHSFLQVLASKPDGNTEQWGVEIGAPAMNVRMGWRKDSVKVGDKVKMFIAPARDGRTFGTLRYLTFEDGRRLDGVAVNIKRQPNFTDSSTDR